MKYTEIFRLKEMLEKKGIPFEFLDQSIDYKKEGIKWEFYHIYYPMGNDKKGIPKWKVSVIQGNGTYGALANLLEIYIPTRDNEPIGSLTAETVFEEIKKLHNKE